MLLVLFLYSALLQEVKISLSWLYCYLDGVMEAIVPRHEWKDLHQRTMVQL
jgi:hypothetical protein